MQMNDLWFKDPKCFVFSEMLVNKEWNNKRIPLTNNDSCITIKKIKLSPNKEQKERLNLLFDQSRFIYNKLIDSFYKKYGDKYYLWSNMKIGYYHASKEWISKDAINRKILYGHVPKYLNLDTIPAHILVSIYQDLRSSIKATNSLLKNGVIHKLPKFKHKTFNESTSIGIIKADIRVHENSISLFPRLFKSINPIKTRNLNDIVINHDCRLQRLKNGKFYLCIPVDREQFVNKQEDIKDYNVCSIDPGIRTFLTAYSPKTNEIIEYGNEEILNKLKIRFNIINSLKSKLSRHLDTHGKEERKIRYRLRKKIDRLWIRIKNIRKYYHHLFSKMLLEEFDIIYLPNFEIKKFDMNKSNNRNSRLWGFYEFKCILKEKAKLYSNKEIVDCSEEYTSKVCSRCFKINENLGSSKEFKCPHCKFEVDRDENGSINILIKNLVQP